jgi:hypothetical protein
VNRCLNDAVADLHIVGFSQAYAGESRQHRQKNEMQTNGARWKTPCDGEGRHLLASFIQFPGNVA